MVRGIVFLSSFSGWDSKDNINNFQNFAWVLLELLLTVCILFFEEILSILKNFLNDFFSVGIDHQLGLLVVLLGVDHCSVGLPGWGEDAVSDGNVPGYHSRAWPQFQDV